MRRTRTQTKSETELFNNRQVFRPELFNNRLTLNDNETAHKERDSRYLIIKVLILTRFPYNLLLQRDFGFLNGVRNLQ